MNSKLDIKPPYAVPSMTEIQNLTPNGIKVISTFSGCGGSSLGYRMAGCTVLGANEFVPAAQEVYRLNASPSTVLWTDDVRNLSGAQMLHDVGLDIGQLDILDGSPPCAAFSTAGTLSNGWGKQKKYSDTQQRSDDLFYEYARILTEIQPKAFIAENVKGLTQGVAKGYFQLIFKALEAAGYNVKASVLDASLLGVPQARKRVIFHGVRKDLNKTPQYPKPLPYQYTLSDVLGKEKRFGARRTFGGRPMDFDKPMMTITTRSDEWWILHKSTTDPETGQKLTKNWGAEQYKTIMSHIPRSHNHDKTLQLRKFNLQELRRICSFPDDFQLLGTYDQRWERLGRSVPPVMMKHIAATVVENLQQD